jgi:3-dehydroquinate dehydratase-2
MTQLLLLNGPNLNLLGTREPEKYGHDTLADIENRVAQMIAAAGMSLNCFQSNAEHQLIERIHAAKSEQVAYILFNPAAFTQPI